MTLEDAIELVIELANQAILSEKDCDGDDELLKGRTAQLTAVAIVEDFFMDSVFDGCEG